jgi:hypothetical protein
MTVKPFKTLAAKAACTGAAASLWAMGLVAPAHANGSSVTFTGLLNNTIPPSFTLGTPGSPLPTIQVAAGSLISPGNSGVGLFSGVTNWIAANGLANNQPFRINDSTGGNTFGRSLALAFNNFTLAGSCAICGIPLTTSSNAFGSPDLFPATALGVYNGRDPNIPVIFAGTGNSQPPITFTAPGFKGDITFTAVSGSDYVISLTAERVPVPGPLPILGAAAAFGWSRKIRKRVKNVDSVAS